MKMPKRKLDSVKNRKKFKLAWVFMPFLATSVALTAYASSEESSFGWNIPYTELGSTPLTYSYNISYIGGQYFPLADGENQELVEKELADAKKQIEEQSVQCADPEQEGSLGNAHQKGMEDARKQDAAKIDMDKIFQIGKQGGCFDALNDFPDLSVNIPTFGSIFNSVKQTLINYATKKVCNVVNEALEEVVGPLKDTLEDLSDRGQLDLNGRVNKKIMKKLYDIDPELGRGSTVNTDSKKYEIDMKGDF